MKPIDTIYKGNLFRSRLEARWAVFFDALGIKWKYEEEGYKLGNVQYLPDFWLPDLRYFIEIKGQYPTRFELEKLYRLHRGSRCAAFVFYGGIPNLDEAAGELWEYHNYLEDHPSDYGCVGIVDEGFLYDWIWSYCPFCKSFEIRSYSYGGGWCCESYGGAEVSEPRIIKAYTTARHARFEHGAQA